MTHSTASTPSQQSVSAYDDAARVAEYDTKMEIMHPNRAKMADIVCAMLPFPPDAEITVLDLGTGTGFLAARLLQVFPRAQVICAAPFGCRGETAIVSRLARKIARRRLVRKR